MKRRQALTNPKANRRMQVKATAKVMLMGAVIVRFAACQSAETGIAANRDQGVETARQKNEHLWKQPADAEQNLSVAGQQQGVTEQKSGNATLVKTLRGHISDVLSVSFSPDGQTLTSGSFNRLLSCGI